MQQFLHCFQPTHGVWCGNPTQCLSFISFSWGWLIMHTQAQWHPSNMCYIGRKNLNSSEKIKKNTEHVRELPMSCHKNAHICFLKDIRPYFYPLPNSISLKYLMLSVWHPWELLLIVRHQIIWPIKCFSEASTQKTSDNHLECTSYCHGLSCGSCHTGGIYAGRQNQGEETCKTMECLLNANRTAEDNDSFSVTLLRQMHTDPSNFKAQNTELAKQIAIPFEVSSVVIVLLPICIKIIFNSHFHLSHNIYSIWMIDHSGNQILKKKNKKKVGKWENMFPEF